MEMKILIAAVLMMAIFAVSASAMSVEKLLLVSDNAADSAVASAIASDVNAAVVLTKWGTYDEATLSKVVSASPRKVVIIGGNAAVPENYLNALKTAGIDVKVVGGKTRQQTSIMAFNEFKNDLKIKPIVADGANPIAVADAVPVYVYDDVAEVREFARNVTAAAPPTLRPELPAAPPVERPAPPEAPILMTDQPRIQKENFGLFARNVTATMVESVHAEIAAFKAMQNKEGIVLGEKVSAIVKQHGGTVSEGAVQAVPAPVAPREPSGAKTVNKGLY